MATMPDDRAVGITISGVASIDDAALEPGGFALNDDALMRLLSKPLRYARCRS